MKNRKFRKGIVRTLLIQSVFIFSIIMGCNLPNPIAPSWDMDLNIPLINKTYSIQEFLDESDEMKADSLNNVYFEFEEQLDTLTAEDQLHVEEVKEVFTQEIGNFSISSPGAENVTVEFRDIFDQADAMNGQSTVVPSFPIAPITKQLPQYERFDWIEISQGAIDISIENNLPIALGLPLTVELKNSETGEIITSAVYNQVIQPGMSSTEQLDLQGKRITSKMEVVISGSSPGSDGQVIVIDADAAFKVQAAVTDLSVASASALVDAQRVSQEDHVVIEDSVIISHSIVRSGSFKLHFAGDFSIETQVLLSIPGFKSPNGETYIDSVIVPPNGSSELFVNLTGYSFSSDGDDFGSQTLKFSWIIKTLHDPNVPIEFYSTDKLTASITLSELYFSEITGRFASKWIDVPDQTFAIDLVDNLDSLAFQNAILQLTLFSQIELPVTTDLHITGENNNGDQVEVVIQEILSGGPNGDVVPNDIYLDRTNSNILELINLIPSKIHVTGRVLVGDPMQSGTLRETDAVNGNVIFNAPLAFMLPAQNYDSDVSDLEIDQDIKDELDSKLNHGSIAVHINSHLPIGAGLAMYFAESDSNLYDNPDLTIGPISFESGEIDESTGLVLAPTTSTVNIELSEEETNYFTREQVYSGVRLIFPGTEGNVVRLLATDYVDIKANIQVAVHVEDSSKDTK